MTKAASKIYISLAFTSFLFDIILMLISALQSKKLYQHNFTLHLNKSYITQLIYSPWFILIIITCCIIFKHLIKYRSSLKHNLYTKGLFQFQFVAKDTMSGSYPETKVNTAIVIPTMIKACSTYNQDPVPKNLPMQPKTTTNIKPEIIQMKQVESEPTTAEWTVVTEKKKRIVVKEKKPKSKAKRTNNNNNKQNKVPNKSTMVSTKPKSIIYTTPVSSRQPWSNVVKTKNEEEELIIQDDLPSLSDNESTTGSIESPCLSYKDLCHPTPIVEERYYSPFSTGFDFGVLPSIRSQHDESMDKYLSHTKKPQSYYTQPNNNRAHKNSILNLLNQTDQVETTITPTCFKYFDDMMMSTSLYRTNDDTNNLALMNSNKREWDAISYIR